MGVLLVKGNIYPFWRPYPIREYSLLSNIRKAMQRHISKKPCQIYYAYCNHHGLFVIHHA